MAPTQDRLGPFPLDLSAHGVGWVFFGSGLLLALTSVVVAPWIQRRVGTTVAIVGALLGFAAILAAMAVWTEYKPVPIGGVVLAGAFLGINNTLITETVMKVAPVERGVASAAYSFVRFSGGAAAPWLAGSARRWRPRRSPSETPDSCHPGSARRHP